MGETLSEFKKIIPILNSSPKARNLMEAFPRVIQFELDGEERQFFITIKNGQMDLKEGVFDNCDILVKGNTKEFAKVVEGKVDVTHPIAQGHITINKGKVSEMTLLNRILVAIKRRE
jgi:putative sterol carrier protein